MKSFFITAFLAAAIGIQLVLATALPSKTELDIISRAEGTGNENGIATPNISRRFSTGGNFYCSDEHDMILLFNCWDALNDLSTAEWGMKKCNTAGNTSNRVGCSNDCAIVVKNPNSTEWDGYCRDVASDVYRIIDKCRPDVPWAGLRASGGELQFSDHSVVLQHEHC